MRFCSLTCPSISASVRCHLQRGGIRLSLSSPGPPWGEKEPGCTPPGSGGVPLLGASLPQLSTLPWNSLPVFYLCCYHSEPPCSVTFCGFQMQPLWALLAGAQACGLCPSLTACVCVGHPCCRGDTRSPLLFSHRPSEKNKLLTIT